MLKSPGLIEVVFSTLRLSESLCSKPVAFRRRLLSDFDAELILRVLRLRVVEDQGRLGRITERAGWLAVPWRCSPHDVFRQPIRAQRGVGVAVTNGCGCRLRFGFIRRPPSSRFSFAASMNSPASAKGDPSS